MQVNSRLYKIGRLHHLIAMCCVLATAGRAGSSARSNAEILAWVRHAQEAVRDLWAWFRTQGIRYLFAAEFAASVDRHCG